jgi:hypothetical protein
MFLENKFLNFAGSIKLALILLSAITLISFAGALLPSEPTDAGYRGLLQADIYYSWWFVAILFIFSINLLICILQRFTVRPGKWGSKMTHFSVLVIMAGSALSFFSGQRGVLDLHKGEAKDSFISNKGLVALCFKTELESFNIDWYAPGDKYELSAFVMDKAIHQPFAAKKGELYKIEKTGYSFKILDFFPDFILGPNGNPYNQSPGLNNPAVLLKVNSARAEEDRWVFLKPAQASFGKDKNIQFKFSLAVKEYRSRVKFTDGDITFVRDIKVNHPVSYKNFSFYQSGYDTDLKDLNYSALEVVKDPGVPLVFTGFIMLNLGIIVVYLRKIIADRKKSEVD